MADVIARGLALEAKRIAEQAGTGGGGGTSDHGALSGLGDDDHQQYHNDDRHALVDHTGLTGIVADHSELAGLENDDHQQYLDATRHSGTDHTGLTGIIADHGDLTGLNNDDHPQYINELRHDQLDHSGLPGVGVVSGLPALNTHYQPTPADVWEVNHGLNGTPQVDIRDMDNQKVFAEIDYIDADNLTITFSEPMAGTATCYVGVVSTVETAPVTLYVDKAVSSSGDGLSWDTAFKTIAEALNVINGKSIYLEPVTVNIKTGSYAENVVIRRRHFQQGLALTPGSGNVTLTGSFTYNTDQTVSIMLDNCSGSGITIGSATYKFVCQPSSVGSDTHRGVAIQYSAVGKIVAYVDANGGTWPATYKVGAIVAHSGGTVDFTGAISNVAQAFNAYRSGCVCLVNLSGSTNTTVLNADGGIILKNNSFSATGTTAVNKANGGIVMNANSTLA